MYFCFFPSWEQTQVGTWAVPDTQHGASQAAEQELHTGPGYSKYSGTSLSLL
jgi:hypothetical protein